MLSEINQTQKDRYCMIPLICGICNSQTHRSRVHWWLLGAWEVAGMEGDVGPISVMQLNKFWRSDV